MAFVSMPLALVTWASEVSHNYYKFNRLRVCIPDPGALGSAANLCICDAGFGDTGSGRLYICGAGFGSRPSLRGFF